MKTTKTFAVLGACLVMLFIDLAPLLMVPEAYAVYGTRRRTARRTAIVVSSASSSQTAQAEQEAAAAKQEAADAQAEADAANAEAEAAKAEAEAAKAETEAVKKQAATGALPVGTIVNTLPEGCPAITIDNVEYHQCGGNYYRATFQGEQLVYVTVEP